MSSDEVGTVGLIYQTPLSGWLSRHCQMAATCFNPANGGRSLPCDVSQGRRQVRTSLSMSRDQKLGSCERGESNSRNSGARSSLNSPLVNYALGGLQRC